MIIRLFCCSVSTAAIAARMVANLCDSQIFALGLCAFPWARHSFKRFQLALSSSTKSTCVHCKFRMNSTKVHPGNLLKYEYDDPLFPIFIICYIGESHNMAYVCRASFAPWMCPVRDHIYKIRGLYSRVVVISSVSNRGLDSHDLR